MATNCNLMRQQVAREQSNGNHTNIIPTIIMTQDRDVDNGSHESYVPTPSQPKCAVAIAPLADEDVFEDAFEASMADFEGDGYESDSESANEEDEYTEPTAGGLLRSNGSEDLSCTSGLGCEVLACFPRSSSFEYHSSSDSDTEDREGAQDGLFTSVNLSPKYFPLDKSRPYLLPFIERRRLSQCKEEDEDDGEKSPQAYAHLHGPPKLDKNSAVSNSASAPPPPPPPPPPQVSDDKASVAKFKDLERLRQQFMHKIDSINTVNIEEIKSSAPTLNIPPPPPPPIPASILPPSLINLLISAKSVPTRPMIKAKEPDNDNVAPIVAHQHDVGELLVGSKPNLLEKSADESTLIRGKFRVTKAPESPDLQKLRSEALKLKHLKATNNAETISFPCNFGGYSSVQGLFSQRYGSNTSNKKAQPLGGGIPHLSKKFFDTSLVEIRASNLSLNTANQNNNNNNDKTANNNCDNSLVQQQQPQQQQQSSPKGDIHHLDDVWIKRDKTPTRPSSELVSPPIRNSTATRRQRLSLSEVDSVLESGHNAAIHSEDVSHVSLKWDLDNIVSIIYIRWTEFE